MTKILIVKLSAIGDVVQTLPALEAIKNTFPKSNIDWVVEEDAAEILDDHPMIHRLLISRRKSWFAMLRRPSTFKSGISEIAKFVRELRHERYDMAIDFQGLLKSGVIMGFARAERKIGFSGSREFSSLFLNERLPAYDIEKHALLRYLDVAGYLGAVDPQPTCTLPIEQELLTVQDKLSQLVPAGRKIVVINPQARWKTKLWREDRFAQLADRLIQERKAVVIFTGGRSDKDAVARIRGMMQEQALDWTGETTLKELAALAKLTDLFITTDTGPMHLAAAAGGRVLAIFGPTAPWRTGPYGPGHIVVRADVGCSPCFSRTCDRDQKCMGEITVDDVLSRLPF